MKTNKWSILVGVTVVILAIKTFMPNLWTRAGEEIQPVIDGANCVISPAFDPDQDDIEEETFEVTNLDQSNPEDEEFLFWMPVGGKPE